MKAMILAAGTGTMMEPLTTEVPKAMLPIALKPNLEYTIELCKINKINNIMINLHHLPEQIDEYFGNGENFGVNIKYSLERNLRGTAGALKRIQSFFDDTFVVLQGNGLTNIDLFDMYKFHKKSGSKITMAVTESDDFSACNLSINNNSQVSSLNGAKSNLTNTGTYIIDPEIIDLIPAKTKYDFEKDLFPKLLELNIPFYAYESNFNWYSIRTLKDYHKLNMDIANAYIKEFDDYFKSNKRKITSISSSKVYSNSLKNASGSIYIGKNVTIKSKVKLKGPLIIGNNCVIEKGAFINNSIILENSHIGKNIEINEGVVCRNTYVNLRNGYSLKIDDPYVLKSNNQAKLSEKLSEMFINIFDRSIALFALLLLLPLFIIVAILIKLDSKGPILYKSNRARFPEEMKRTKSWFSIKRGRYIAYYVFRTMYHDSDKNIGSLKNKYENGPFIKITDDPRVTRIGKILRKTSIDELTLLWNVLLGEMSLVGIWALPIYEAEYLRDEGLKSQKASEGVNLSEMAQIRFNGKLGLAGFWQARGRSNLSAEERALHDTFQAVLQTNTVKNSEYLGEYLEYKGLKKHLGILIETAKSVVLRTGAI